MHDFPHFYPPSPRKVPRDLALPSVPFRKQMNVVGFCMLVFFLMYFGAILFLVLAFIYCVNTPGYSASGRVHTWDGFRWIFALVCICCLFVLIRNLFYRRKLVKGFEVEIFPDEHPDLFEFLECICEETGAPMPDRVLINHEVNAAAGCEVSVVSLIRKPELTLILGLGLINAINMTEFKALLAHEFGHFSQQHMRSGPYVRLAFQVIWNILTGTNLIGEHRLMTFMFIFLVKLKLALSREMEFHADLIAVEVAGSDAVCQLLYKSVWADACFRRMIADLEDAEKEGLYSDDVFLHHHQAANYIRQRSLDAQLGEPPVLPDHPDRTFQLFVEDEDEHAKMWSDHPSNYERELNAKADYVRSEFDEASPWQLFRDPLELRRRVSKQFYRQVFKVRKEKLAWSDSREVEKFLKDEYAETIFDPERYGTLYNHRNVWPGDPFEMRDLCLASPHALEELLAGLGTLYTPEVKQFAKVYRRHVEEHQLLSAIVEGWYRPKNKRFTMRGSKYHLKEAKRFLPKLQKDQEADLDWLHDFDAAVFMIHFELAQLLDPKEGDELFERYHFHIILQAMWSTLQAHKMPMNAMFRFLSTQSSVINNDAFYVLISVFRRAYEAVREVLDEAKELKFPNLKNLPAGKLVRPYLLDDYLREKPSHFDMRISYKWLISFAEQFREVEKKLDRLHFKSLGNILAQQESVADRAKEKWGNR